MFVWLSEKNGINKYLVFLNAALPYSLYLSIDDNYWKKNPIIGDSFFIINCCQRAAPVPVAYKKLIICGQ